MQTQVVPLDNADAATLEAALSGMSSGGGSVSFDPATNSMILTDEPAVLQNMMGVIRELDQMKSQITQVLIEAKIVEVETEAARELGVRWFVQGDRAGGGYTPSPRRDALLNSIRQFSGPNANESLQSNARNTGAALNRRFIDEDVTVLPGAVRSPRLGDVLRLHEQRHRPGLMLDASSPTARPKCSHPLHRNGKLTSTRSA